MQRVTQHWLLHVCVPAADVILQHDWHLQCLRLFQQGCLMYFQQGLTKVPGGVCMQWRKELVRDMVQLLCILLVVLHCEVCFSVKQKLDYPSLALACRH